MSQIIVEPEEILRFAAELKAFTEQVRKSMWCLRALRASFRRLGGTFPDQQHQEFARDLEGTMRLLEKLVCIAEE